MMLLNRHTAARARFRARRRARTEVRLSALAILFIVLTAFAPHSVALAQDALPTGAPVDAESLCLQQSDPLGDEWGSISGTVTAASDGAPIKDVIVRASDRFGRTLLQVQSSITGTYSIDMLTAGDYTVRFMTNGSAMTTPYVGQVFDGKEDLSQATLVHVAAGADVTEIDAALAVGAVISGTVTDAESGDPIAGVAVSIYAATNTDASLASAQTDANGIYRFRAGFAPGDYLLFFFAAAHQMEWYGDAVEVEDATPITITGTQAKVVNNALMPIPPAPEGRITGRVTIAENGNPVPGARVIPFGQGVYSLDRIGTTNAQGYYTLTVPIGTYKVMASQPSGFGDYASRYFGPDATYTSAVAFPVSANQTAANKNIALEGGFYISGTVTLQGGDPADNVFVQVYEGPGVLESGFTYSTQSVEGAYALGPLPKIPFNLYLQPPSALCNYVATTIPVNPEAVSAAAIVNSELVEGVILTGRVTSAVTGAGIGSAFVAVYAADGKRVTGAASAGTGYYILPAVAAGSYRIGFDQDGYADQYYDNKPSLATASVVAGTTGQGILGIDAALAVDAGGGIENGVYIPFVMRK